MVNQTELIILSWWCRIRSCPIYWIKSQLTRMKWVSLGIIILVSPSYLLNCW